MADPETEESLSGTQSINNSYLKIISKSEVEKNLKKGLFKVSLDSSKSKLLFDMLPTRIKSQHV